MKRVVLSGVLVICLVSSVGHMKQSLYDQRVEALEIGRGSKKTYGDAVVQNIISIYDGDTFRVDIENFPDIVGKNISIRVNGIDTPEIRTKDPVEKEKAIKARDFARDLLYGAKVVMLKNLRRGKYFRIIADVHLLTEHETKNLAEELLKEGHAIPYGKTRDFSLKKGIASSITISDPIT